MKYEQIDIDPSFARSLLEASTEITQRSLSQKRVALFAHDMETGRWRLTHQAIAVDPAGQVIDGQHRLAAVVESGATVTMMVATDADPATFGVIDTGRARTVADALRTEGYGNTGVKASAARMLLAYDRVRGTRYSFSTTTRAVTNSEVLEVFSSDSPRQNLILVAEPVAARIAKSVSRMGVRSWMTAAYVIASESALGPATVSEFFERVNDGARLDQQSPILALRRFLISDYGIATHAAASRPGNAIAVTLKTLNDYTQGRERTLISFKDGKEDFPEVLAPDPTLLEREAEARESESNRRQYRRRPRGKVKA